MHRREKIRNETVTALTGLTTTGSNVYNEQLFPLEQAELPAIIVATGDESIEEQDMDGIQERELEVLAIGVARARNGQTLKNTLDTILEEIETALVPSVYTNILALELTSVEFEPDTEDVDQAQGAMLATFTVTYQTTIGAPSA